MPPPTAADSSLPRYSETSPLLTTEEPRSAYGLLHVISKLPSNEQLTIPIIKETLFSSSSALFRNNIEETACVIATLLYLLTTTTTTTSPQQPVSISKVVRLSNGVKNLEILLSECWNKFITEEVETDEEDNNLQKLLWFNIPLKDSYDKPIRVADLVSSPRAPNFLVSQPHFLLSMVNTWFYSPSAISWAHFVSPWSIHAIFFLYHFTFVILLADISFSPPSHPNRPNYPPNPPSPPGAREYLLFLYSLLSLRPDSSSFPYILIIVSLLWAFPSVPTLDSDPHTLLIFALAVILLQLHLPSPPNIPTPILLFHPARSVPIACFVQSLLQNAIFPAMKFFSPALILLFVLFGMALQDSFPPTSFYRIPILFSNMDPADPQVRLAIVFLFLCGLVITLALIQALMLIYPTFRTFPSSRTLPENQESHLDLRWEPLFAWDRFGYRASLDAKLSFFAVVSRYYTTPQAQHHGTIASIGAFPPLPSPLNGVGFVFATLPGRLILKISPHQRGKMTRIVRAIWMTLWIGFVGIPAAILGAVFVAWRS